jgi:hypothetical protein
MVSLVMGKRGSMRYQAPSELVLIQCLTTEWTKRTREAGSAGRRNRLPEMLPLPSNRPGVPGHVEHQAADIYYHHVHYDEWNNYQKPYDQFWIPLQLELLRIWRRGEEKYAKIKAGGFHEQSATSLHERIQAAGGRAFQNQWKE